MALTDKQEKFVQALILGKSQREAYKASFNCVRMKDEVIDVRACELFKTSKVKVRFEALKGRLIKEAEDECICDAKDVLKELMKIAFSNGSDFAKVVTKPRTRTRRVLDEENGEYVYEEYVNQSDQFVEVTDTDQLPESKKASISSIRSTRHGIKVESYDKMKALELIGKSLGMFKEKIEISGEVKNPFEGLSTEDLKKMINDE